MSDRITVDQIAEQSSNHLLWRLRNNDTAKHLCGLAADRIEEMERSLLECREWVANQIEADLDYCCPKLPDGSPNEEEMDEVSRPMIKEMRALLSRIDAAISILGTSKDARIAELEKAMERIWLYATDTHLGSMTRIKEIELISFAALPQSDPANRHEEG